MGPIVFPRVVFRKPPWWGTQQTAAAEAIENRFLAWFLLAADGLHNWSTIRIQNCWYQLAHFLVIRKIWVTFAGVPNNYDMLKYYYFEVYDKEEMMNSVACSGNLRAVQWLHSQGCLWNEEGGLQGCPWNVETFDTAAEKGNLEMLQWLHSQGCPWSERTCSAAARQGH